MSSKLKKSSLFWILLLALGSIWIIRKNQPDNQYKTIQGPIFGTIYQIKYQSSEDLQAEVREELNRFDYSLSPFKEQSIISKVNRNEEVELDSLFIKVFNRSKETSKLSDGAFDITVAPLINAWGFGFKQGIYPDSLQVDSLLQYTGYQTVKLEEGKVIKQNPETILNCSAIAKGYSVDIIGDLLHAKGIKNYMINIGGEVLAKGVNGKNEPWQIGINKPTDDSLSINQDLEMIVSLKDKALATSGNYRNFYIKDGKKYAHTINPKTGYPVQHNILSATVLADDCMTADALATTFMVLGLEQSLELLKQVPQVEACFIYTDEEHEYAIYLTEGMKQMVVPAN